MDRKREKDEHLENLYYMKEKQKEAVDALKASLGESFDSTIVDELVVEGMVELYGENHNIRLTKKGDDHARQLIRAHRLAERLLYDVLGGDFEPGACEFEHTVNPALVDSICTLLGHPRQCPHGTPIPEGECCKRSARIAESSVIPITELTLGQSARVAYVNCRNDQELHKLDGLRIRPGVKVKVHQKYPSYVIECEGSKIALDELVAANICVWKSVPAPGQVQGPAAGQGRGRGRAGGRGRGRGFGLGNLFK